MPKSLFEDELIAGMQKELHKQATAETPNLAKAADCLHSALEIFEAQGMRARADQVLALLEKLAQTNDARNVQKLPSTKALMEAGLTQRDMHEFAKGSPIAKAKFNLVLRSLGMSDSEIAQIIGKHNVMSEDDAKQVMDPNRSFTKLWEWMQDPAKPVDPANPQPGETIELRSLPMTGPGDTVSFKSMKEPLPSGKDDLTFKSIAQKKSSLTDRHTKGLTPEKEVENLKHHGTPFNMSDDHNVDVPQPPEFEDDYQKWVNQFKKPSKLKPEDVDPDLAGLLDVSSFDIDASDDELMGIEISDDLEVFDADVPLEDFEDERD